MPLQTQTCQKWVLYGKNTLSGAVDGEEVLFSHHNREGLLVILFC